MKREFGLEGMPIDYIISVHIRNMIATHGEEVVKAAIEELFEIETYMKKRPKKSLGKKGLNKLLGDFQEHL